MSATKLTLSIPEDVLASAKAYSKKTKQPLSQLVTRYFRVFSPKKDAVSKKSSRIQNLTGIIPSSASPDDQLLLQALTKKYGLRK